MAKREKFLLANFRPIVIIASTMVFGLLLGAYIWNTIYALAIAICVAVISGVIFVLKKQVGRTLAVAGFLLGIASLSIFMNVASNKVDYYDTTFTCRIISIEDWNDTEYDYAYFVEDITANDTALNKSGILYTNTDLDIYSTITINGNAQHFTPDPLSGYDALDYQQGIRYYIYESTFITSSEASPTYLENKLGYVKDTLVGYMGVDNGALGVSILFGDRSYLSDTLDETFSIAGLSHVLCVSGLHVSFVIAMVYIFLKKLNLHNVISLGIMLGVLYCYGVITGFPVSLIRATIMYTIVSISTMLGMRYDMLNSISLTAIIMLIASPITIFNVSFQLSFTAILGICLFYNSFKLGLNKLNKLDNKMVDKLMSGIAVSLSANVLTFPLLIHYFGYFGSYFIIANLIVVPAVSLLFSVLWVFVVLMLFVPILAPFTVFARYFAQFIVNTAIIIAKLPFSSLSFASMGILTYVYFPTVCLLADVNCAPRYKKLQFGFGALIVSVIVSLFL